MIQASDVVIFRNWALNCMAGVIMPPAIRKQLKQEVETVTLPLYMVIQCGTVKAKWNVYCNRVISAVISVLDDSIENNRIITDFRERLEHRRV